MVLQQPSGTVSVAKADAVALATPTPPTVLQACRQADHQAQADVKYHKLGLFTLHGVGYTRWRTPSFAAGGESYNLDAGVGFNFTERFGVYGLVGGAVGARILDKQTHGSLGHFAISFLVRRKYVAFIPGIGLAVAGRRGPGDARVRETGVAIPLKLMGLIPLPKDLTLTVGLGYDLAILAQTRPLQTIALQVGVARF
ncbi:MAG: hypothetical protein U0168_12105 [Nannocystaceae bacterium]